MIGQYLAEIQLFENLITEGEKKSKYWENRLLSCQMKFLAMYITNQKLSFDIFTVVNLQNIFMEHDLYLMSSINFLAIATNIPQRLKTGFVVHVHIIFFINTVSYYLFPKCFLPLPSHTSDSVSYSVSCPLPLQTSRLFILSPCSSSNSYFTSNSCFTLNSSQTKKDHHYVRTMGRKLHFFKKKREMKPKLCFWRQYDMWIFPFLSLSYWTHGRRVWFSNLPMATSADSYSQQMAPNLLQHQTTSERCEMGYRGRLDNSPLLPPHQSLTTSAWGTAKEHEKEQSINKSDSVNPSGLRSCYFDVPAVVIADPCNICGMLSHYAPHG